MAAPQVQGSYASRQSSGVTWTADMPAGVTSGELLVAVMGSRKTSVPSWASTPSGWTSEVQIVNANGHVEVWTREADGTEGATQVWTHNTGGGAGGAITVFRVTGFDSASPIDAFATQNNTVASTTVDFPAHTTTGADRLVFATGVQRGVSASVDSWTGSLTERWDGSDGATLYTYFGASKEQAASGSTGTYQATSTASNTSVTATFSIAPADAPPGGWSGRTAPDGLLEAHKLIGGLSAIDEDPDTGDGDWLTYG